MSRSAPPPRPADNAPDPKGEFPLAPAEYLFYLLFQAGRQRDLHFARSLERAGLNIARWRTLAIIRRMGECTMKALALYSTIDRTTLTRAVDQLVEQGLVERAIPNRDRRKVCLSLTPAGEALYAQAVPLLLAGNAELLAGFSDDEVRHAVRLLQTAIRRMIDDPKTAELLINFGRPG
jgi:DNA-binding MarR family transcriptional regulator